MVCWEELEVGGVIIILVVVLAVLVLSLGVIICAREGPICDCCHQAIYVERNSVVYQGRRRVGGCPCGSRAVYWRVLSWLRRVGLGGGYELMISVHCNIISHTIVVLILDSLFLFRHQWLSVAGIKTRYIRSGSRSRRRRRYVRIWCNWLRIRL